MVHIKRVDLRGFKTFGRKVSLGLDKGLTVITGPNGAGKSNIMDGIKFALGELSPKELRGGSLSDLIHKPSPEMSAQSAWVAIQFDNQDRRIPVDSDFVTVAREFRKGGEGIYRLNGRRVARKQLADVLSSVGILVTGHNLVPQHAVTKLAEITSEERRRIIEDLTGIGVYDVKKAEAQVQLQQADLNLRVASARIDEVRTRVESLEKERNDLLRSTFLKNRINKLQAQLVSDNVRHLWGEIEELRGKVLDKQSEMQSIKNEIDRLATIRSELENERRKFEEETVEKGGSQLFEIERNIGDVATQISRLRTEVETGNSNLETLRKQREDLLAHLDEMSRSIKEKRAELDKLKAGKERLLKDLQEKKQAYEELSMKITEVRNSFNENTRRLEAIEDEMAELSKQLVRSNAQIRGGSAKLNLTADYVKTLETRKSELQGFIEDVENRLRELSMLAKEEQKRLREIDVRLSQHTTLKSLRQSEISEASEIAKKAGLSLAEFETRRSLAETFATEAKALMKMEQMGKAGAISGIYGRLKDLIKVKEKYQTAAEAASRGWMDALVVDEVKTAVTCVESLKKTKLGRIKIVPLTSVASVRPVEKAPSIRGVLGRAVDFVKCDEHFVPAVNFVFGDTVFADSQKAAYLSSLEGTRAVTISGDTYEPSGGMIGGYYREPLDIDALTPKPEAIKSLEETVQSLESLIKISKSDVERLDAEIVSLRENKVASQDAVAAVQKEVKDIENSLSRFRKAISLTAKRLQSVYSSVEKEKASLSQVTSQRSEIQEKLTQAEKETSSLRLKTKPSTVAEHEGKHSQLTKELNELRQSQIELDGKISALESILATLLPTYDREKIQLRDFDSRIEKLTKIIEQSGLSLTERNERLKELEQERDRLSSTLGAVRERRSEFESELRKIESQSRDQFNKYEPLNIAIGQLNAEIKEKETRVGFSLDELHQLGFDEPVGIRPEDIDRIKSELNLIKRERDSIGLVNELATQQYEEQKNNYKQLSTRINELEREKLSIVNFMNEIEKKKYDTFMNAFAEVNREFQEIFSKITSGGTGRLLLENQEDPFKGGVDVFLRFPGKSELAIGSASGGEKSVATVVFIIALQSIYPMPFYMFDEIDAHLDIVNTQRLAELLRERSRNSQFIVISLKDTTISRAERVYGVYVQEGSSQVVSLPTPAAT